MENAHWNFSPPFLRAYSTLRDTLRDSFDRFAAQWLPQRTPGLAAGTLAPGRGVTLHEGDGVEIYLSMLRSHRGDRALVLIDGDHTGDMVLREPRLLWSEFPQLPIVFRDTYLNPALESGGPAAALQELLRSALAATHLGATQIGPPGLTWEQPVRVGVFRE